MTTQLTAGSLFSGAGWLSLAVEQAMGATTRWVSDVEPAADRVLARRFPGAPNLGDITAVDWATVEPVDIIEGGSPCQDVSTAGRRAGMTDGTRSNLWVAMREAVRVVEPKFVIWENVAGAPGNGVVIPQAVHAIRGMLARAFSSMTTQPELIETCRDCGDPSPTPICDECTEIAELFGLTPEQRLTQIGGAA